VKDFQSRSSPSNVVFTPSAMIKCFWHDINESWIF
jgi:hypothetical protein